MHATLDQEKAINVCAAKEQTAHIAADQDKAAHAAADTACTSVKKKAAHVVQDQAVYVAPEEDVVHGDNCKKLTERVVAEGTVACVKLVTQVAMEEAVCAAEHKEHTVCATVAKEAAVCVDKAAWACVTDCS